MRKDFIISSHGHCTHGWFFLPQNCNLYFYTQYNTILENDIAYTYFHSLIRNPNLIPFPSINSHLTQIMIPGGGYVEDYIVWNGNFRPYIYPNGAENVNGIFLASTPQALNDFAYVTQRNPLHLSQIVAAGNDNFSECNFHCLFCRT